MSLTRGVDVSEFQPRLDWSALVAEGCRFAFVRLGDGAHQDLSASAHYADARAAGVLVGPYWFARDWEDPAVQTARYIAAADAAGRWDFPLCVDYERESRQWSGDPAGWLTAALDTLRARWPNRRIPAYVDWYALRDLFAVVRLGDVVLWIPGGARYDRVLRWADEPGPLMAAPAGRATGIWQFTRFGRAGIYDGDLDLNLAEGSAIDALTGRSTVTASKVVAAAQGWVGTVEQPPGSNNVPGITDCTGPTYWCAAGVTRWFDDAGVPLPRVNGACGFTYCPTGVTYAVAHGETVPALQARAGDIVIFSWEPWATDAAGVPRCTSGQYAGQVAGDHTGIVETDYDGAGWLSTIEANTANENDTDGIYVARRSRHVSLVCCIWRPAALRDDPPPEPPFPTVPCAPGESGLAVEALQRWLASRGRPDLNPGTIDAHYGPWTFLSVQNLQRIVWGSYTAEIDGVWGPLTIARVADHLAGKPITVPPPDRHEPQPHTEEDTMILVRAEDAPTSPDQLAPQAVWMLVGDRKMWVPDQDTFAKLGGAANVRPLPWAMLNQLPAIGTTYPSYAGPKAAAGVDTAALAADVRTALGHLLIG